VTRSNRSPIPARAVLLAGALRALGCSPSSAGSAPSDASADQAAAGNHALHFDGTSSFATNGTAGFPASDSAQSFSMWVRVDQPAGTQVILALRKDVQSGVILGLQNGGTLTVWTVFGAKTLLQAPAPEASGWHHVEVVQDPAAGNTLYVDAVAVATSQVTPNNLTPLSSFIGSYDGWSEFFSGDLDEIRIWKVARTAAEVGEEMAGTASPSDPGLLVDFDCDSIEGTRMIDLSGNGNDATLGEGDPALMPTLIASTVPPGP
jgi:hypothetical protein